MKIEEFVLPPRGTSKPEEFEPLAHLELEEIRDEDEESGDPDLEEAAII